MFNEYVTFGESIIISVFCIGVVFIALYVISFIVDITKIFTLKREKKTSERDASSIAIIGSADGPTSILINKKEEVQKEDETELVAVITAAIAAMTGADANGIVVKSIKKLPDSDTSWSRIGRIELMR